jgi:hypothetical protein
VHVADKNVGVTEETFTWRAPRGLRIFAVGVLVVFAVLVTQVAAIWGYLATIGIILVLGVMFQVYWQLLRPKLTAGPDGVYVVSERTPVRLAWTDIRRVEAGTKGLTIICADGRAIVSRVPHAERPSKAAQPSKAAEPGKAAQPDTGKAVPTEQERTADYLTRRAAWARKSTGPKPQYATS